MLRAILRAHPRYEPRSTPRASGSGTHELLGRRARVPSPRLVPCMMRILSTTCSELPPRDGHVVDGARVRAGRANPFENGPKINEIEMSRGMLRVSSSMFFFVPRPLYLRKIGIASRWGGRGKGRGWWALGISRGRGREDGECVYIGPEINNIVMYREIYQHPSFSLVEHCRRNLCGFYLCGASPVVKGKTKQNKRICEPHGGS